MKNTFMLARGMPREKLVERIAQAILELPQDSGYRVEIHDVKSQRNHKQNRTLWWIYDQILERGGEMLGGWTREDLHEFALGEWAGWEVHEAFGRKRLRPVRRSSRLSKMEFAEFVDFIYRTMEDKGLVLDRPDPDMATYEHEEAA